MHWPNGQTNIQNVIQKPQDRATRTQLKPRGEFRCVRRISSFCSTCDTRRVTLVTTAVISLNEQMTGL